MSADIEEWPPPNDATAFESLCLDLWKEIWKDPGAQKNGRSGQPQAGVDVFGQCDGRQIGVQCKQKDGLLRTKVTKGELEQEVDAAKKFQPALSTFILATTGPRDASLQECARLLSEQHKSKGMFSVEVWSWKEIWRELYQREVLLKRIERDYWPRRAASASAQPTASKKRIVVIASVGVMIMAVTIGLLVKNARPKSQPIPNLPQIRIESLDGLPEGVTSDPHLRLNRLVVQNVNDVEIQSFCSRLQLPEPIGVTLETNKTTGTLIGWKPLLDRLSISGTGGRTEGGLWIGPTSSVHYVETRPSFLYPGKPRGQMGTISRAGDLTGIWELTIDRLPARGFVDILFLTSNAANATNYTEFAGVPLWQSPPNPQPNPDTNELRFYLEGEYQYQVEVKPGKQHFFVPIGFDSIQRKVSSLGVQPGTGHWHPVILTFQ